MPKKKLTIAQVKRKYKTISNAMYDLMLDKAGHSESYVKMSLNKAVDDVTKFNRMFKSLK